MRLAARATEFLEHAAETPCDLPPLPGEADRLVKHPADDGRPLLQRGGDLDRQPVHRAAGAGRSDARVTGAQAADLEKLSKLRPGGSHVDRCHGDFTPHHLRDVDQHRRVVGHDRGDGGGDVNHVGLR
jgi:hypothetical protein